MAVDRNRLYTGRWVGEYRVFGIGAEIPIIATPLVINFGCSRARRGGCFEVGKASATATRSAAGCGGIPIAIGDDPNSASVDIAD